MKKFLLILIALSTLPVSADYELTDRAKALIVLGTVITLGGGACYWYNKETPATPTNTTENPPSQEQQPASTKNTEIDNNTDLKKSLQPELAIEDTDWMGQRKKEHEKKEAELIEKLLQNKAPQTQATTTLASGTGKTPNVSDQKQPNCDRVGEIFKKNLDILMG